MNTISRLRFWRSVFFCTCLDLFFFFFMYRGFFVFFQAKIPLQIHSLTFVSQESCFIQTSRLYISVLFFSLLFCSSSLSRRDKDIRFFFVYWCLGCLRSLKLWRGCELKILSTQEVLSILLSVHTSKATRRLIVVMLLFYIEWRWIKLKAADHPLTAEQ